MASSSPIPVIRTSRGYHLQDVSSFGEPIRRAGGGSKFGGLFEKFVMKCTLDLTCAQPCFPATVPRYAMRMSELVGAAGHNGAVFVPQVHQGSAMPACATAVVPKPGC